jgi:predicted HTH domain antitoxin
MCRAIEEMQKEVAIQIAIKLIEMGNISFEDIAKACRLSLEDVQELAAEINAPEY